MKKRISTILIASLLLVSFIVPAAFFVAAAPRRTEAASSLCLVGVAAGIAAAVANLILTVPSGDLGSAGGSWTGAGGSVGDCIYNSIVVPMLRGLIRSFLQRMTQSTIAWINGTGNPSGKSFVPNLSVHLQGVGDSAAMAFLNQLTNGFQSPFDMTIAATLRNQYLQQTSMAGFFSQYRSTLSQASPNINAFLAGNWSQGGVKAWFALTTQSQNNPYTLYQAAAAQLGSSVADAQANRRQDLLQSGGFLSFCPGNSTSAGGACFALPNGSCPAGCVPDDSASTGCSGVSIKPQAACVNPDGTPAQATTPGSVIMSYLQANVNSGIGQFVSAQDLDGALLQVVQALANRVLSSTGLFGSSSGGGGGGGTGPGNGTSNANQLAGTALKNLTDFTTAWNTIKTAATNAQSAVAALQTACNNTTSTTILTVTASDMQNAINTEIQPVLQKVQNAFSSISATQTLAQQLQTETSSTNPDTTQITNDVIQLMSMPPSASDVATAQQNAQVTGQAKANPSGSLTVSGGSLVDQMNLINTNAQALASQCPGGTGTGTGTGSTGVINGGTLIAALSPSGTPVPGADKTVSPVVANQTVCFNFAVDSTHVGNDFNPMWYAPIGYSGGGNITDWISSTFGGTDIGGTQRTQIFKSAGDTNSINYHPATVGTYYYCFKVDTVAPSMDISLYVNA